MSGYDYIVVGGGSSGCVTAARLVRDFRARVLLIEAGPRDASSILGMPAGYMKFLASDRYLTMHKSTPQPQLDGRAPIIPQGRVLGGGSAVNAMVYMRGQALDYDKWDRYLGQGSGWSYRDILPHFRKQEDNDHLAGDYHGVGGGLKVSHLGHHCTMSRAYVKTIQSLGYLYNPDFNGAQQAGVGFMQHTIDAATRRRCSARDAFLQPIIGDPRLTLATQATVTRIEIENGTAKGVRYLQDGKELIAHASAEVILTAGSYITPKLLMLSGIGPAAHLNQFGIDVKVDLPGVGQNLQDHHEVPMIAATNGAYGYFGQDRGFNMLRNGLQYLLFKSGPVTTTGVESCAFIDPEESGEEGTIQLYCVPTVYIDRDVMGVEPCHGVTLTPCVTRPKARGTVTLRSANPLEPPLVNCNFFGDAADLKLQIAGMRFARRVMATAPMRDMISKEMFPGPDKTTDSELETYAKKMVKTTYHPSGTCKMGPDGDAMAVLDSRLRVRGVEKLRIFDISMMPTIISANTNAAAMAIADRAVDMMLGKA